MRTVSAPAGKLRTAMIGIRVLGGNPPPDRPLFRRYRCGSAFLTDEDHQDLGRNVALIE
jgi:hypothetical protein